MQKHARIHINCNICLDLLSSCSMHSSILSTVWDAEMQKRGFLQPHLTLSKSSFPQVEIIKEKPEYVPARIVNTYQQQ